MEIESIFFFILGVSFVLFTLLVLKKGTHEINLSFAIGTSFLAIASFFCAIAFGGFADQSILNIFGLVGNIIMFFAPLFFFISGFMIFYGKAEVLRNYFMLGIFAIYGLIAFLYFFSFVDLNRGLSAGALILMFGLLLDIVIFGMIYTILGDQKKNVLLLLVGMMISVIALFVTIVEQNSVNILPMELSSVPGLLLNFGILIASLAFTSLPEVVVNSISRSKHVQTT